MNRHCVLLVVLLNIPGTWYVKAQDDNAGTHERWEYLLGFSGTSFIQRPYGWKYGKYSYILAALVGVSRMEGPDWLS
jgi:hypothetical protein